jgi:hypothetical protein
MLFASGRQLPGFSLNRCLAARFDYGKSSHGSNINQKKFVLRFKKHCFPPAPLASSRRAASQ